MRLALFVPIYYALSFVLTVARSIVNVLHYNKYHLELRFYDIQITRDKYFPSITKYTVFNLSGGGAIVHSAVMDLEGILICSFKKSTYYVTEFSKPFQI